MVNITLAIPEDVKKEMENFPEINWSEIARAAIKKRITLLQEIRKITKDSELNEKDVIELGKSLKKGRFKKLKEQGLI